MPFKDWQRATRPSRKILGPPTKAPAKGKGAPKEPSNLNPIRTPVALRPPSKAAWGSSLLQSHHLRSISEAIANSRTPKLMASAVSSVAHLRLKVTRHRSTIGMGEEIAEACKALQLSKLHKTAFCKIDPKAVGNLVKVIELVKNIKIVKAEDVQAIKAARKPTKGFVVLGNAMTNRKMPRIH